MINRFLEQAYKLKKLIGIRTVAEEWDESLIGFVTELSESSLTLNEIDKNGLLTGKTIIQLRAIVSLDFDDRYQKRLGFIHDKRRELFSGIQVTIWGTGLELAEQLEFVKSQNEIATFYFDEDNYVVGLVLDFDSDFVSINNIGVEGDDDGVSCHRLDKMIGLKYKGIEEQKVKLLHVNRHSFYLTN